MHHDIWDYDMPPRRSWSTSTSTDGRSRRSCRLTKQAFAYVFDRANGQPVWPIAERRCRRPTCRENGRRRRSRFPSKPPAFDQQGVTENDLIDFTPELAAKRWQALKGYRIGPMYTPALARSGAGRNKGTFIVPGFGGGANWEGGAADPETGFVYVGSATRTGGRRV